ncbi:substrate-binding periplasmic protein [Radicibacter daui]|uniref:substrate-binding periplasmic protein n=1 Tax=Radicibacter daui TaxID=3064829 RepID=UPI004046D256
MLLAFAALWGATAARADDPAAQGRLTTLRIGFRPIEPLVVQASDGGLAGSEVALVGEILRRAGFSMQPVSLPALRLTIALASGDVDVVAPGLPASHEGIYPTRPFLVYRNVAIALRPLEPPPQTVADLLNWRIIAFPGAHRVLGDAFRDVVAAAPNYHEETQSPVQVLMAQRERVDLMVGERRILRALVEETLPNIKVFEYPLFTPNLYPIYFRRQDYAGRVDAVLAQIDPSGEGFANKSELPPADGNEENPGQ